MSYYIKHTPKSEMALNSVISGGIRTYTKLVQAIQYKFILDVEKGETKERGELSKTYYDAQ